MRPWTYGRGLPKTTLTAVLFGLVTAVGIHALQAYEFATPIFKLAVAPDSSLLVADAGAGIVELRHGAGSLVAELPGVTDIAPIGRGDMFALEAAVLARRRAPSFACRAVRAS